MRSRISSGHLHSPRPAAAALVAVLAMGGCSLLDFGGDKDKPKQYPPFQRSVELERQMIADIKAPIDYDDAAKIANYYLKRWQNGTLLPAGMVDDDRYWKVQLMSYSTGTMLDGYMRIDKQTGGVSGVRPAVKDVADLLSK